MKTLKGDPARILETKKQTKKAGKRVLALSGFAKLRAPAPGLD